MQKIIPFLWFNNQAEQAVNFYTSIFKNSKIGATSRYGEAGPGPAGSVMVMEFEIDGQKFTALNGGPIYNFTPAISFFVNCSSQEEVDYYWEQLSQGGEKGQCGWLKDKYGISWQIVPTILGQLMSDPDAAKAGRVTRAMLKMTKLDIATLEKAYQAD
jgi:predicted 3-demethylubiquinone-9 3-methyltransferase (glyoxalase superfamily)